MFYDERIENIKGHIIKNSTIMALIISLTIGGIRFANVYSQDPRRSILDIVIILCCLILLITNFLMNSLGKKDERKLVAARTFYNKLLPVMLGIILLTFAIMMPILLLTHNPTIADRNWYNTIIIMAFIIGIYVIYSFKANGIYFNYSIIENDHYYINVLKNIGKLCLIILSLLVVSMCSFILYTIKQNEALETISVYITLIVIIYIIMLVALSLIYFTLSVLEKLGCKKSALILLTAVVVAYAVLSALSLYFSSLTISMINQVMLINFISNSLYYIRFALLTFLIYWKHDFLENHKNKLFDIACKLIIASEVTAYFAGAVFDQIYLMFAIGKFENFLLIRNLSVYYSYFTYMVAVVTIISFILIIVALIKGRAIPKANIIAIVAIVLLCALHAFLSSQGDAVHIIVRQYIMATALLLYMLGLVIYVEKKLAKEQ